MLSILLLAVLLIQTTSSLWIWAGFYLNRDYIAATLCINRFDRIPVCKGVCYLQNEMNEQERRQEKWPGLKLNDLTLFCQPVATGLAPLPGRQLSTTYPDQNTFFIPRLHHTSIFKPPCPLG